ncbi:MAG: hypothetical protein QOG99_56 [Frankiales bacterium]|nr:hypothetical protein [Frankiales bacterium]
MSTLLGALQLSGRGGNELFVYDDCLVRASTGLLAALTGGEFNLAALSGRLDTHASPEVLVMQHPDNRLVRRLDIREASLSRGRWPATGLRRLTLTLHSGTVLRFDWPGDSATRPLNHDEYASALLASAFDALLTSQL